jgi:putative glycerol-1-phosphate prenyltransferase
VDLDYRHWRHVFKLDPDKELSDGALERICLSGTDAVMVGGSSGVTFENTVDLLSRIRRYTVPCVLEVSAHEAIVPGFDLNFIPVVLNTGDGDWITGMHQRAIREYGSTVDWGSTAAEGYVILNPHSTAARVTGAKPVADGKDLAAYARLADRLFRLPIFYVEYSGVFGNMEWVKLAKETMRDARLFYGGGIASREQATEAAEAAHTIVVGNILYDNLEQALATVLK